ncbi:cupin domain-containing protein [Pseudomonas lactucae]|uniref:cupin domain-containing protein n=1 Tax=Pseudomonas lactucae TaxID=2813360 RepID=UPI002FCCF6EC
MPAMLHYCHPASARRLPSDNLTWVDDPLAHGRSLHWYDAEQGYGVGGLQSSGTRRVIEDFPWVELGIVESGTLVLQGQGFNISLHPGDCFVIPRGITLDWHQPGDLRYLCMVFPGLSHTAPMPSQPLKIDPFIELQACNPPALEVLLSATPQAWSQTLFSAANLRIGVWECEAYARKTVEPGYCELMHILKGAITLSPEGAAPCTVHSGETVVVPAGASNAWSSTQTVRKIFCILS